MYGKQKAEHKYLKNICKKIMLQMAISMKWGSQSSTEFRFKQNNISSLK